MFGAAALLAAGCAEEIVDPESQPAGEPSSIVFTAGVDTRTTLVPDDDPSDGTYHQIHWVNGDRINVDGVEFSTEDDGAKAYFTTEEAFDEDNDYVAIYPATAGTALSSVTIPAAQQAVVGDFHSAAAVSVAVSNTTTLDFKNVTSILKFQVPVSAASVTISADEPLAGEVSVDYNNGEPTWESVNAVNSVTVTGEFEPEVDYYVTILPGTKTNFTVRIDGVVSRVATTVNAKRSMVMNMGVLPEPIGNGISFNGSVYEISSADGLAAALSNNKVTEVKIVEDIEYSEVLWIKKDLTIDLNDHIIEGTSSRFIRVASETEDVIDVVIKNGTILNNVDGGRCVETRSGNVALELNGVVLNTPGTGANQPLTIGGSGNEITVDIISSVISTNHINGYAITTFNPVIMNITNSEVSGWLALNIKAADNSLGSAGSTFNVTNYSTLSGRNAVDESPTNNSGTITIEDKNVTINVDSQSTIEAVSTNSNKAFLVGLGSELTAGTAITGTEVTIEGTLVLTGENPSYFNVCEADLTGNTIKFPELYADDISEEGWSVSDPVDGLITVGKMPRELAFSAASATAVLGEDFTAPELSGDADGVEYASSNTSVATVDPATGEVTLVAAGETTITATAAETGAYSAGVASYTLTVYKRAPYSLIGSHNGWSFANLTPMYEKDGYYFVEDVEFTGSECKFKFIMKDATDWNSENFGSGTTAVAGNAYRIWSNGGDNVVNAGKYDIYFSKNKMFWFIVTANAEIIDNTIKLASDQYGLVGNIKDNDWGTAVPLYVNGKYLAAKSITFNSSPAEFKIRQKDDWNGENFGTSETTNQSLNNSISLNGGNNVKVTITPSAKYDVYTDLTTIKLVNSGTIVE